MFVISYVSDPSHALYATRVGFGLVTGLFLVRIFSVTSNVHGFYRSYTTGVLLRGTLMHTIYRRVTSDQLTDRAKLRNGYTGVGNLMSLMSADVMRIDFCCAYFHSAWTSILKMLLCFALTVWTMVYSALPGFGLLALLYPLQTFMVGMLLKLRRGSMPFTDARVKAVVEAVSAIRLVKTNAYEKSLLAKIGHLRGDEVVYIRKRMLFRALNTAVSYTAPMIAAVLAIVTYGAMQGGLKADVIFSSLAFFMLLRTPLQVLFVALSAIADARAALKRLAIFMLAPDAGGPVPPKFVGSRTNPELDGEKPTPTVVAVEGATFAYHDDEALSDERSETSTQNTTETVQHDEKQGASGSQTLTAQPQNQSLVSSPAQSSRTKSSTALYMSL